MNKAVQEIVADLRKADMLGTGIDAGAIADRIELAFAELEDKWRQRVVVSKTETTTVGNAAAMREALVWMSERMNAALHEGCLDCDEALGKIDAALSAPARNCERFQTGEEAWLAFERENPHWCHDHKSNDPDCTDCEWADCGRCMAEWLFAPAAERKGESYDHL